MIPYTAFLISCVVGQDHASNNAEHPQLHILFLSPDDADDPRNMPLMSGPLDGQDNRAFKPLFGLPPAQNMIGDDPLEDMLKLLLPSPSVGQADHLFKDIMRNMPIFNQDDHFHMLNHATRKDHCVEDVKRYCPRHRQNAKSYFQYMAKNKNRLSLACLNSIKQTVPFVCDEMRQLHCDGLETGILDCLTKKMNELHPECQYAIKATQKTIKKVNAAHKIKVVNSAGQHVHTFEAPKLPLGFYMIQFAIFAIALLILWGMYQHRSWTASLLKAAGQKTHTELANAWASGIDDDDKWKPRNAHRTPPSKKSDYDDSSYAYGTL